jgi:PAT family beta-lactamase induction signal transducer AmpG
MSRHVMRWVVALYFAQGFPFGVFADVLPVFFRTQGMSLVDISFLMSPCQLAWSVKACWSPLVDRFGSWRLWMAGGLAMVGAALLGLAAWTHANADQPLQANWVLMGLLAMFALASATQDIAIDAYFVRLVKPGEEGLANGWRVGAYRAAMLIGGGAAIMVADVLPWDLLFAILALVTFGLMGVPGYAPAGERRAPLTMNQWFQALRSWLAKPGARGVFIFLILYKFGDMTMSSVVKPFWVDHGRSVREIGTVSTTIGMAATVIGSLFGGWYVSRRTIYRGLWVLGAWQAVSNLGYAAVAWWQLSHWALYAASVLESLTQGLGTAAQLALITRLCDREHAATQFAMLTALFGLSRAGAGLVGAWGAEHFGYAVLFVISFFLCLPAAAFLPQVRLRLAGRAIA